MAAEAVAWADSNSEVEPPYPRVFVDVSEYKYNGVNDLLYTTRSHFFDSLELPRVPAV